MPASATRRSPRTAEPIVDDYASPSLASGSRSRRRASAVRPDAGPPRRLALREAALAACRPKGLAASRRHAQRSAHTRSRRSTHRRVDRRQRARCARRAADRPRPPDPFGRRLPPVMVALHLLSAARSRLALPCSSRSSPRAHSRSARRISPRSDRRGARALHDVLNGNLQLDALDARAAAQAGRPRRRDACCNESAASAARASEAAGSGRASRAAR